MKRLLALVLFTWFAGSCAVRAQSVDEQYVHIYNLIQQADSLSSGGRSAEAQARYVEAQTALQKFQKLNPDWNTQIVKFRLNYLAGKITTAPASTAPATNGASPTVPPNTPAARAPVPSDWESQLSQLRDQIQQLKSDTGVLQSKLKEALSAQPAAMDPRELARAQDKIKSLQKENDLLNTSLAAEKSKPASGADTKALAQSQQALAEANRKLNEQTEKANALATEKQFLQDKLALLVRSDENSAALTATKQALQDANRRLAEQKELAAKLALEKESLQVRFKTLGPEAEAAAALRAENQLLKKQLAEVKNAVPAGAPSADTTRQLAQAQAQIAALQSDKELLRLEKVALENRVKQLSASVAVASAPATVAPTVVAAKVAPNVTPAAQSKPEDVRRIKQLEGERDDLQKKLAAATKELYTRKNQAGAAHVSEMENQLANLRARLEVFEARQVPYTTQELAMFKAPEPKLADPRAGRKSVNELPAGSKALVLEAQHYYANKQLDKAEQKYLEVLKKDEKNVPTLANLAAIELDLDHLDAAEKNVKQATTLAPDDAYSFLVLGRLKFRQQKYDEAVDALSRAAKLQPQDPQIQNFLGLALNEKGLRGPAETALRKAIQLDPDYGSAHNNLAVMYITQTPPLYELAWWHYQKALAAGHPKNPSLEQLFAARKPIE